MGLGRGAGGNLQCPRSVDIVHDPGSGAVTEAAPSQVQAASGASHAQERCPWLGHTEGVLPTSSHSPCCSDGGCSCEGKELLVGGNQAHRTRVQ